MDLEAKTNITYRLKSNQKEFNLILCFALSKRLFLALLREVVNLRDKNSWLFMYVFLFN